MTVSENELIKWVLNSVFRIIRNIYDFDYEHNIELFIMVISLQLVAMTIPILFVDIYDNQN